MFSIFTSFWEFNFMQSHVKMNIWFSNVFHQHVLQTISSRMAASIVHPCLEVHPASKPIGCANCTIFHWDQPENRSALKKCKSCHVVQYCSKDCKAEHWELVHKHHCKELRLASTIPVGLYSHHPFPLSGQLEDTMEMIIIKLQRVIFKLGQTGHPAWDLPEVRRLEESLRENRQIIWAQRKLSPKKEIRPDQMVQSSHFFGETSKRIFYCPEDPSDPLGLNDLWSTLQLLWGRLNDYMALVAVNSLKEPHRSVPKKMWKGVSKEVGLFSSRLQELILAFPATQVLSFLDLLKVFCGGSLNQKCSFCHVDITVGAIAGEVYGNGGQSSCVLLRPHLPLLFSCKAIRCFKQLDSQDFSWLKWHSVVKVTYNKLRMMECNFCFKLSEDVHRYVQPSYLSLYFKDPCCTYQVRQMLHEELVQQGVPLAGLGGEAQAVLQERGRQEEGEERLRDTTCGWNGGLGGSL